MFKNRKRPNFLIRWFEYYKYEIQTYGFWRTLTRPTYIYIRNWFRPFNHIRISTLPRDYCEVETRLLHGIFQLVVDFVEIEWQGGKSPYFGHLFDLKEHEQHCKDNGYDEEHTQMELELIKRQNASTQEIWDLYNWWTKTRPARKDLYDEYKGPRSDFYPTEVDDNGEVISYSLRCANEEEQKQYDAYLQKSWEFDDACEKEDEEMMIRVIKIRGSLWT